VLPGRQLRWRFSDTFAGIGPELGGDVRRHAATWRRLAYGLLRLLDPEAPAAAAELAARGPTFHDTT